MSTLSSLASRVKLATVSTGAWRPYRLHKGETQQERARHNTDAVNVRVRLTDSAALRAIVSHYEAVGREHRRLTLPTPSADMRMLVAGREFEHTEIMRDAADKHTALVDAFMAEYPAIAAAAPLALGSLYEPDAWPDPDAVRSKFKLSYRYLACPTGGAWDDWLSEAAALAQDAARDAMRDSLATYSERLRNAQRLHDSAARDVSEAIDTVFHARDICDPAIMEAANAAIESLTFDTEALRRDKALRESAADKAAAILSSFQGVAL